MDWVDEHLSGLQVELAEKEAAARERWGSLLIKGKVLHYYLFLRAKRGDYDVCTATFGEKDLIDQWRREIAAK